MAINYKWTFSALNVVYSQDSLQNVIQTVDWILTATDESFSAYSYGTVGLPAPSPASFTPYEQVTEAQVQTWTQEAIGLEKIAQMEKSLAGQIEAQKKPKGGSLPPPWVQS